MDSSMSFIQITRLNVGPVAAVGVSNLLAAQGAERDATRRTLLGLTTGNAQVVLD